MFHYSKSLKECTKCNHQWYDEVEHKHLKTVDFIWVNKDYQAFEWFIELLVELELQQISQNKNERFINFHLYMTSSKADKIIKLNSNDIIGLKTKPLIIDNTKLDDFNLTLHSGRPNFDLVNIQIV